MSDMPKSQSNKGLPLKGDGGSVVMYSTPSWLTAFSTGKGSGVEDVGLRLEDLALPRQVHSDNVLWMKEAGRPEATDAVITDQPGLCVCVKTADCIPVLLYDTRQRIVAAVHAGWRGTVARIVQKTIEKMKPLCPTDLHAIIGPGISLEWFEVGNEVYEAFKAAGFPMERIAPLQTSPQGKDLKWHLDLWEANKWLLEEMGVSDIYIEGTCTRASENFYSARRETINTGRNYNGILINEE
ncbi:MAG: peptidoglycan editing factor PgeF [Bacteroidaceae bacterium]|nr:peptidoglycan editing factor PgeF [Bacteroidaceae bacterium]